VPVEEVSVDVSPGEGGIVKVGASIPRSFPYSRAFQTNSNVRLEAIPEPGYHFANWGGDLTGSENPATVKLSSRKAITAHFLPDVSEFTSDDKRLNIVIPEGTTALSAEGDPLASLEFTVYETSPPPPQESNIVGVPYNLGPHGATFDQPVTLTWSYDPADIPFGMAEEDLVLAYYDEDASEWVVLPSVVDPVNNILTAFLEHFTIFAILTPTAPTFSSLSIFPPEVSIGESVSISVLVANTEEEESGFTVTLKVNGALEETKEITLTGGSSETITFTTTEDKAGTYSVDVNGLSGLFTVKEAPAPPVPSPPASPSTINWVIVAPAIAVVVFVAVFFPMRLRRRRQRFDWEF